MGNQITRHNLPAWVETPLLSRSLGSQDLDKHRALVGFELEVLSKKVDRFGWDRDRGTPAHDRIIVDWMDVLQDFMLDEIKDACKQAIIDNPKKCPNEGTIRAIIMRNRSKVNIPKPEFGPIRPSPTPESKRRVAEMVAIVGTNLRVK